MPERLVTTGVWDDARFCDLPGAPARLVFFRLLVGPETTAAGTSRVHPRRVAADCALELEDVRQALDELVAAGLVRRYTAGTREGQERDAWWWLPAFIRRQARGPDFIRAARRSVAEAPPSLRRAVDRALEAQAGPNGSDSSATAPRQKRDKKGAPEQGQDTPGGPPTEGPAATVGGGPTREKGQGQDPRPYGPRGSVGTGDGASGSPGLGAGAPHGGEGEDREERRAASREAMERLVAEGGAVGEAIARARQRASWEAGERGTVVPFPERGSRCEHGWAAGECPRCELGEEEGAGDG